MNNTTKNNTTNTTTGARLLASLPVEELREIIHTNEALRQITFDALNDSGDFWLGDFLRPFDKIKGLRYEFNPCGYGNYIKCPVSGYAEFIDAFICSVEAYDDNAELIALAKRLAARADFYAEAYNGWADISEKNYYMFESWMESGMEKLYNYINEFAENCYDFSKEAFEEEFIGGVLFNNEDLYIDDDGNIFETIVKYYN